MPATPIVKFDTLGCRLNQAESDAMAEELWERGFRPADTDTGPDLVVVNTCTVTKEATKASRSTIRRAVRDHPDARIVVIGCYAVSNPEDVAAIDGVDVVLDNTDKEAFANALSEQVPTAPLLQIGLRGARPSRPPAAPTRVRANLKVQTGCDEGCTFCIIPSTRGPLRSFDVDDLVEEARRKVAAGTRELVLTGVHLGKYGFERGGDERDLLQLIERLIALDGLARIRLSSIFPAHLTDDLLSLMAAEPRLCRHLHVPLQSGDDGMLRAMHRPYSAAEYVESVMRAKERIPGLALATDIIVGFPGETDDAFAQTMDVAERVQFCKLHVFRYSARDQTPAATMQDQIAPEVKRDRSKQLIARGNEIRAEFLSAHLRDPLEVLVEDRRSVDGAMVCSGQTDDYVRVWFEDTCELGSLVRVQGVRIRADGIEGRRVAG